MRAGGPAAMEVTLSSTRTFEFEVAEGASGAALMEQARSRARQAGIAISGDESGGSFKGTATGSYVIDGRTVRVQVDSKPAFVPWAMIESGLRRMFT
jgi:hypothetical protein